MTITVTVEVPEHANYKAVVQHIDQHGSEGKASLAGVVPPGDTHEFHVHSTREVVVSEQALTEEDLNLNLNPGD